MTIRSLRRASRPIARVLVFAWLLALGVSWANACVAGLAKGHTPAAHHATLVAAPGDAIEAAGDAPAEPPSLAACQGFCDAVHGALAKSPQHDASDLGAFLPASERAWAPWPRRAVDAAAPAAAAPPPPVLPVAIAFLRLNR